MSLQALRKDRREVLVETELKLQKRRGNEAMVEEAGPYIIGLILRILRGLVSACKWAPH